jgi:hypothetical protein
MFSVWIGCLDISLSHASGNKSMPVGLAMVVPVAAPAMEDQ